MFYWFVWISPGPFQTKYCKYWRAPHTPSLESKSVGQTMPRNISDFQSALSKRKGRVWERFGRFTCKIFPEQLVKNMPFQPNKQSTWNHNENTLSWLMDHDVIVHDSLLLAISNKIVKQTGSIVEMPVFHNPINSQRSHCKLVSTIYHMAEKQKGGEQVHGDFINIKNSFIKRKLQTFTN